MSSAQVELYVRQPGHPERRYLVSSGVTQIGRADDNDVVLSDLGVSRRHARIRLEGERLMVEDLGSGNGTWYRGEEIESQVIGDGDEVQIDPFVLLFRYRQGVAAATDPDEEVEHTIKAQKPQAGVAVEARLVVLAGHRLASVYPIPGTGLNMGRSESRDVVLFDPGASRNHLRIECRPGGYWLVDLGSANGTYLNGQRIREHPLMPGDRIRIGSTEFRMEIPGGAAESMHRVAGPTRPDPMEMRGDSLPQAEAPRVSAPRIEPPRATPSSVRAARSGPSRMEWAMAIGVLGGLVLVMVTGLILVQILGKGESEPRTRESSPAQSIELIEAEELPEIAQDRMAEGQIRFHEGDYFLAVQNFIKVNEILKEQEEPDFIAALWLERTAYEAIVFEVLRNDLLSLGQGQEVQRATRKKALKSAREALKQEEGYADARKALVQAQGFGGGREDEELRQLKAELDLELIETTQRQDNRDFRARMSTQVSEGDQLLKAGNYRAAIALYESVLEADSDAETHAYYDAEDGIKVARSRILAVKTRSWQRVEAAFKDDDDAAAATALREILRVDPDDERAAQQLQNLEAAPK